MPWQLPLSSPTEGKKVTILDVEKLKAFSGFNPNYLHLADINAVKQSSL
jgi:hypothetical protein